MHLGLYATITLDYILDYNTKLCMANLCSGRVLRGERHHRQKYVCLWATVRLIYNGAICIARRNEERSRGVVMSSGCEGKCRQYLQIFIAEPPVRG